MALFLLVILSAVSLIRAQFQTECTTPGYTCRSCTHQLLCIQSGTQFEEFEIECDEGSSCVNAQCVAGALCNNEEFKCSDGQRGFFPDPFNCTLYHQCGNKTQTDITCSEGSYNAQTGNCGYPMDTEACLNGPIQRCSVNFEVGVTRDNPSIYYICLKDDSTITPKLFRCPGSTALNLTTLICD